MPRVLCVTSNFPRWLGDGTTSFVLNLAQDLQALGWQVDVLAPHAPGVAREEQFEGIAVRRFQYLWPESLQTLCYQGGALINLRLDRRLWLQVPPLVAAETVAIGRQLRRQHYDLIHAHWILPQGFAAMVPARLARVPYVVTAHGGDILGLQSRPLRWWKRIALSSAAAVTANSTVTECAVRAVAPGLSRLSRIPMGVDVSAPAPEPTAAVRARYRGGTGPLIAFVGRMVFEKGVDDLVAAIDLLRVDYPGIRCIVIGEGQQREEYEALTRSRGLENHVSFLGWVEPEAISAHLAAADCFVGPSKRSPEGAVEAQGLTFLEAMAAGTPVVATRSGGIVDYIRHEETGLLVAESAPQELAQAVRRILAEPDLAARLAAAARACVVTEFNRATSARRFSELFEQVLAERARAAD